jgi:hypothetical protein
MEEGGTGAAADILHKDEIIACEPISALEDQEIISLDARTHWSAAEAKHPIPVDRKGTEAGSLNRLGFGGSGGREKQQQDRKSCHRELLSKPAPSA